MACLGSHYGLIGRHVWGWAAQRLLGSRGSQVPLLCCWVGMAKRRKKNPHAVALGSLGGRAAMNAMTPEARDVFHAAGGKAGGRARAAKLTPDQRKEIAAKAAAARWGKKKPSGKKS
jgi:hypothetical protein